jgi:hypothetical protein
MEMPEMHDQRNQEQCSGVRDQEIRAALDQHWAASDANDFETEHLIYREDAVLEYPQSGERTRGRRNIQARRAREGTFVDSECLLRKRQKQNGVQVPLSTLAGFLRAQPTPSDHRQD